MRKEDKGEPMTEDKGSEVFQSEWGDVSSGKRKTKVNSSPRFWNRKRFPRITEGKVPGSDIQL